MVRSIGADHVIDYTQEDFTRGSQRYDVILDGVANRSASECAQALEPGGIYIAIPFSPSALLMGPFISRRGGKKVSQFSHKPSGPDLDDMRDLIEDGQVMPIIDRQFALENAGEALEYYGGGHSRGKVVITVERVGS
jgi:NADPH:quinone reductase-like Zn-dependent oxidoreductase